MNHKVVVGRAEGKRGDGKMQKRKGGQGGSRMLEAVEIEDDDEDEDEDDDTMDVS